MPFSSTTYSSLPSTSGTGYITASGIISGFDYVATPTTSPQFGQFPSQNILYNSFIKFDTLDTIPINGVLTKVELIYGHQSSIVAGGLVTSWRMNIFQNSWLGDVLTTGDWAGGVFAAAYDWPSSPSNATIDLGAVGISEYNNSGTTDIKLVDNSTVSVPETHYRAIQDFTRLRLRATYTYPNPVVNNIETKVIYAYPLEPAYNTYFLPEILNTTSELRHDDIGLIRHLRTNFVECQMFDINTIDGFPGENIGSIPIVSVEHDSTFEAPIELGGERKNTQREYMIDIFARTRGERRDIYGCIEGLIGTEFSTDDARKNTITDVELLTDYPLPDFTIKAHKKYFYLNLDGSFNFCTIPYTVDFDNNFLTIDMDLTILNQNTDISSEFYILDYYQMLNETDSYGYKIYLDTSNFLHCVFATTTTDLENIINFTPYKNRRVRLTFVMDRAGIKQESWIYINGSLISHVEQFFFIALGDTPESLDMRLGVSQSNQGYCKMRLYDFRMSSTLETTFALDGEYLGDNNNDFVRLKCNEGRNNKLFNNLNETVKYATVSGYPYWVNYKQDNDIGNFRFRQATVKIKTECLQ